MKNIYLLITFFIFTSSTFAQLADIRYSVRTVNVTSYENSPFGDCWEIGNEEYTAYLDSWDNVDGTWVGTGCQTCNSNGDCTYGANIGLQTRTNNAYTLGFRVDAWEDDDGGRCDFDDCFFCFSDDCRRNESNAVDLRNIFPSNNIYTNTPTWGGTNNHQYTFQYTWKYAGNANQIFPSCAVQNTSYSGGAIRSWSVFLTAGLTYNFQNCGSPGNEDTYMRLYNTDGYTVEAIDDDGCGGTGNSSLSFTPSSSGYYYLELSHFSRSALTTGGTLSYQITTLPTNNSCSNAIPVLTGSFTGYNTTCATQDAPAQACGTGTHNDVWYTVTPLSSGSMTVSNCGASNYNSRISVYSGSCGALSLEGCDDNGCSSTSSSVTITACKGITYYISIGGINGAMGAGILSVTLNPSIVAPAISCPSAISANTTTGLCTATVTYATPVGTDNCPGASTTQTAGLASGAVFPLGVTTNTFRVIDSDGVTATCSFTVTVTDNQPPVISCPSNIAANSATGVCSAVATYTAPVGTDNCSGAVTVQTSGLASGSSFPVGVTTNTFRVTAANGVTATCSFTVTITNTQVPTITCPANISVSTNPGNCSAVVSYATPAGSDNCAAATTTLIAGIASGGSFPVGTTTNTFRVTSPNGQSATCSFTVTVTDNEAPAVSCAGKSVSVNNDLGSCGAIVNYSTPVGTDNCPGAVTTQLAGQASGSFFALGTTTNTFRVTASNGQSSTCSLTVTVTDAEQPSISCAGKSVIITAPSGSCEAAATYTGVVGTDNCPGATTTQIGGPPSGSIFPAGSTPITFQVTDAVGLVNTCSFTITVVDNQPPVFTSCPSNIVATATPNLCAVTIHYTTPVGTDNCDGVTTSRTSGLASGSNFPGGVTTVTYVTTDAGGTSTTCSFTVTINDVQAPTIICPNSLTVESTPGLCGAVVNYTPPPGNDNCPGATTTQIAGLASGSTFPTGATLNTFRITAQNGQSASCSFNVTVNDTEIPSLTCPANVIVSNDPGTCSAVVTLSNPVYTDNCGINESSLFNDAPFDNLYAVGETLVFWMISDINGNTSTCFQTVHIDDTEAPSIECAADQTQPADPGLCSAFVIVNSPLSFNDNCPDFTYYNDYTFL